MRRGRASRKLEDHLRMARQTLQEMREERGKFEIEKARNDSDRQHLRETCLTEVNAQPEDLIASETAFMTGEELATAEASYREMKQRIENMGAVNMMALEEFNECEQRFTFLTRERDDLLQSIADTQQAIKELDLITKEKFEQAFAAINANFTAAFHTIFGGGTAEMRLTEPDSSGDAGIDIVASPPGKRLQNVLLLSGGEKAMTALALLIAIFRYQPSPFCILDEVDAPLDEANVGPLHAPDRRHERADAVHRRHPQSQDHGNRQRALRRHHAGARRFQARQRPLGRRGSARTRSSAPPPRCS